MSDSQNTPLLAPPGAGLPWIQHAFGRYLWLPYLSAVSSWERCSQRFAEEGRRILSMVEPLRPAQMAQRVLVNGVIGIEDSSRFWSPAMVLEHLVIAVDLAADIIVVLTHDRDPPLHMRIAELKPSGVQPPDQAIEAFRQLQSRYERRVREEISDPRGERRWPHPWFGPLNAHGWHCLVGLHHGIHRRQLEAILRGGT